MVAIRDSNINALTIGRGAPFDASERSAWPHRCAPNDVSVIGIKCPEDAALLAKAHDIAHKIGACPSKIEILASGNRTVRLWSRGSKTCRRPGIEALQSLRPLDLPRL